MISICATSTRCVSHTRACTHTRTHIHTAEVGGASSSSAEQEDSIVEEDAYTADFDAFGHSAKQSTIMSASGLRSAQPSRSRLPANTGVCEWLGLRLCAFGSIVGV